jgi:hypothetical protein
MPPLRTMGFVSATLGLTLVLGAPIRADGPGAAVEVFLLDRAPVRGTFVALSADSLTVKPGTDGSAAPVELPLAGVRDLHLRATPAQGPALDRLRVTLTSGEELVAETWGPAPDGLALASPSLGQVRVPLETVRSIVPLPAKAGPCHDPARRLFPQTGADVVRLVGGDQVQGTVAEVKAQGLVVELERDRRRTVAWGELAVAALDNPAVPYPDRAFAEVETHAGDLLQAAGAVTGDLAKGLALTSRAHPSLAVVVPPAAVRAVRWRGGRCVDATTLPRTDTFRPISGYPAGSLADDFLQRFGGVRAGRRPQGCPLRLDGTLYRHGLAAPSGSECRIALGGGFKSFQAVFGIDDEAREAGLAHPEVPGANVDARVVGDGKVLWEAKGVTEADKARAVGPFDVTGVKELVLIVDYGAHDAMRDRATWAEPLLLR